MGTIIAYSTAQTHGPVTTLELSSYAIATIMASSDMQEVFAEPIRLATTKHTDMQVEAGRLCSSVAMKQGTNKAADLCGLCCSPTRRKLGTVSWAGSDSLVWDAHRLRVATDAAGVALWSWNVDTDEIAMDERAHSLWGVPRNRRHVTFEDLSARIHPADLDRVRKAFEATRDMLGAYDLEFRIVHDNAIRWVSARGQGDDLGIVGRVMFGVFLDVTERKQAEEVRELLAGEMSHRVKNLFAIASALTSIAARSATTTEEMSRDLTQRLAGLGRAHNLVRPIPGERAGRAAPLIDLLAILLGPYDTTGAVGDRIQIGGPEVQVGEAATTTVALIVHELATNSLKYGALSAVAGSLGIACMALPNEVVLVWTERGGPPAAAPAESPGFGTRLVSRSISGQLGGSIVRDWTAEGLVVTLRMDPARLAA